MPTPQTFFVPPTDPMITGLTVIPNLSRSEALVAYVKAHGYTYPVDIARKLGIKNNMAYRLCEVHGLKKRAVAKKKTGYWRHKGYVTGKFGHLDAEVVGWLVLHTTGSDSLVQTAAKLLRGDAQPHPTCGCGLCLRSRERSDNE